MKTFHGSEKDSAIDIIRTRLSHSTWVFVWIFPYRIFFNEPNMYIENKLVKKNWRIFLNVRVEILANNQNVFNINLTIYMSDSHLALLHHYSHDAGSFARFMHDARSWYFTICFSFLIQHQHFSISHFFYLLFFSPYHFNSHKFQPCTVYICSHPKPYM